jgi:hypothetical protein
MQIMRSMICEWLVGLATRDQPSTARARCQLEAIPSVSREIADTKNRIDAAGQVFTVAERSTDFLLE